MVERSTHHLDAVFKAMGDTTRRDMLRELAKGDRTVTELAKPHPMSLAAASKHIRILEEAGLVSRAIRWRTHLCHLEAAPLQQALDELKFYERFWTERLDALAGLLSQDDQAPPDASTPPTSVSSKGEDQ